MGPPGPLEGFAPFPRALGVLCWGSWLCPWPVLLAPSWGCCRAMLSSRCKWSLYPPEALLKGSLELLWLRGTRNPSVLWGQVMLQHTGQSLSLVVSPRIWGQTIHDPAPSPGAPRNTGVSRGRSGTWRR